MIAIVDYGMGNLRSVEKGFLHAGHSDIKVTSDPEEIRRADALVVPGVGAFRDCRANLDRLQLSGVIIEAIQSGKPYLGICLGLQILFSISEEFGASEGLDLFKGRVVSFPSDFSSRGLKVPHMGWNSVSYLKKPPIMSGIPNDSHFYFVHSYYVVPDDENIVSGISDYGLKFTSMIWQDNIFATQFHPEKSQVLGLKILENFGNLVKGLRI